MGANKFRISLILKLDQHLLKQQSIAVKTVDHYFYNLQYVTSGYTNNEIVGVLIDAISTSLLSAH